MNEHMVLEKARYIFTSGRLIHDRVDRVIMGHLLASGLVREVGRVYGQDQNRKMMPPICKEHRVSPFGM